MRVSFKKGYQRKFFDLFLEKIMAPSLSELRNRGIDVNYNTLKNYYSERRKLPLNLFEVLCKMSDIDKKELDYKVIDEKWGQSKGGKISKRNDSAGIKP